MIAKMSDGENIQKKQLEVSGSGTGGRKRTAIGADNGGAGEGAWLARQARRPNIYLAHNEYSLGQCAAEIFRLEMLGTKTIRL